MLQAPPLLPAVALNVGVFAVILALAPTAALLHHALNVAWLAAIETAARLNLATLARLLRAPDDAVRLALAALALGAAAASALPLPLAARAAARPTCLALSLCAALAGLLREEALCAQTKRAVWWHLPLAGASAALALVLAAVPAVRKRRAKRRAAARRRRMRREQRAREEERRQDQNEWQEVQMLIDVDSHEDVDRISVALAAEPRIIGSTVSVELGMVRATLAAPFGAADLSNLLAAAGFADSTFMDAAATYRRVRDVNRDDRVQREIANVAHLAHLQPSPRPSPLGLSLRTPESSPLGTPSSSPRLAPVLRPSIPLLDLRSTPESTPASSPAVTPESGESTAATLEEWDGRFLDSSGSEVAQRGGLRGERGERGEMGPVHALRNSQSAEKLVGGASGGQEIGWMGWLTRSGPHFDLDLQMKNE